MRLLTLKLKDIKTRIALLLGDKLAKEGFVYKKSNNQFIRNQGDFVFIFNILLTSYSDHISLDVRLYIQQNKIEKISENIVGKSYNLTIGNDIGRIYKSPDGRQVENCNMVILIIQNEDVEAAVETLERYYDTIAKSYYQRYSSLEAMDDIINNPPFEHCPAHVGGRFDSRCMKGLIVARLVNNPNYEKLAEKYDEVIKETMNSQSIENYYKVREYLMYNKI